MSNYGFYKIIFKEEIVVLMLCILNARINELTQKNMQHGSENWKKSLINFCSKNVGPPEETMYEHDSYIYCHQKPCCGCWILLFKYR